MTQTLLITGASSGIGAATARAAVKAGWQVALLARSRDALEKLAAELGDAALALPCDITERDQLSEAVAKTVERFGGLDAVYANAGKGSSSPGIEQGDPDDWHAMIHLNVLAVLTTAHATLPHLRKTKGHFVVTGSKAGRDHMKGSVYGATKWFVQGLAGNLAEEMREWGGRCTLITPGMVDTPFFDEPKPDKIQPDDVANAVVFALSQPRSADVREIHIMPSG
ncbi:MAG: SDR family oxidoreductase [Pseudomonadota bacterium]|jgi:NADP-dependent 3-hydroxy acid dehydrogenase YdfG|uniref:SDR family oxidoreductase n=1 Tax=Qipengyuania flava TaxID=192812 RepID=UPI000B8BE229|nr:SDR family oxidoreductase [Qipengyuania flava]MAH16442.1 NAD(P)-dependent oxidoreductase [Sphingomonadaceae bacterium]MEC7625266.1 SDR family oxidoreductase [Pseudomonadota bacterium]ASP31657.1 short-chain dehydrogenase [Qipengyuania flava]MEC8837358.1 SDR family oxidoreductase [Pseudomonadota bacterium]MEE3155463.1 SDR family oxidoreductase [Pseudomonadota bacterium]